MANQKIICVGNGKKMKENCTAIKKSAPKKNYDCKLCLSSTIVVYNQQNGWKRLYALTDSFVVKSLQLCAIYSPWNCIYAIQICYKFDMRLQRIYSNSEENFTLLHKPIPELKWAKNLCDSVGLQQNVLETAKI